ncbi:MAG: fasciclin domain-containing protein [Acidimicrobiia bacterium]
MTRFRFVRALALALSLTLVAAACGDDDDATTDTGALSEETTETETSEATTEEMTEDETMSEDMGGEEAAADSATICDADAIVEAVEGGAEEGTLEGMTDDPVGTAASNNPVLTTLTTAVTEAGLVDTLNSAEALTVFAPTDCAFAALDPATLEAALADPSGLLTQVLGFHVIAGERLSSSDLGGTYETFTGEMLEVSAEGDTVTVGGGQANVLVPDIMTANATVHLIDAVMLPPSAG